MFHDMYGRNDSYSTAQYIVYPNILDISDTFRNFYNTFDMDENEKMKYKFEEANETL